jgi:hypothetical protein
VAFRFFEGELERKPGFLVDVASNAPELARAFGDLVEKQLPFATAVALTRVAVDAQTGVRRDMPHRFRLRNRGLPKTIELLRAEKRDWPDPKAQVRTRKEFLALQETGGTKRPRPGGSHVVIPTRVVTTRLKSSGAVPKRLKPRNLKDARYLAGDSIRAPLDRRGAGFRWRVVDARFYLLRRAVRIRARFRFLETAHSEIAQHYPERFRQELVAAVKSARVKAETFSSEQGRVFYLKARDTLG